MKLRTSPSPRRGERMAGVGVDAQAVARAHLAAEHASSPVSGFLQKRRTAASSDDVNVATTGCSGGKSRPLISAFIAASTVSASFVVESDRMRRSRRVRRQMLR